MKLTRALIPGMVAMLAPLALAQTPAGGISPPASPSPSAGATGVQIPSEGLDEPLTSTVAAADEDADAMVVELAPTEGSEVSGTVRLAAGPTGVRLTGRITGLAPESEHGFHVHEKGDCSAPDASSAGPHFNPEDQPHGAPSSMKRHLGDMPNIKADASGAAAIDLTIERATLDADGANSLMGRGLIVHADPDDYESQPSGNAGARLACGAIGSGAASATAANP